MPGFLHAGPGTVPTEAAAPRAARRTRATHPSPTRTPTVSRTRTHDALLHTVLSLAHEQLQQPQPALSVPRLCARLGVSHTQAIAMLSRLRDLGLFEGTPEAPYFRITPRGRKLLEEK